QAGAWMYSYSEQKDYTWEQARNYCQTYFTDLVAIQNKKEIEYLNEWLPFHPRYYWIGIRKLNSTWTWVGTRKALTKEAENWAEKEPNNKRSNQDCVEIYIKRQREPGKWNDEPCSKRKRALCYEASCQPLPCSQRGECMETIGNYSCECRPGFHGRDCENGEGPTQPLRERCSRGTPALLGSPLGLDRRPREGDAGSRRKGVSWQPWAADSTEGLWSDETCSPIAVVACPVLSAPDWGELSCAHLHGNFSFGSTCTFSCHTGFVLTGTTSRECTATGDWSGEPPRCEATRCPTLVAPAMGYAACSHLHSNFSFGSTCTFSCHTGFVLTGTTSRECTATGDWSGEPPQCEAIKCPTLVAPAMGYVACSHLHSNFSFGSTCTFSCHTGFVLTGTMSRECTATGDWSGEPPQCEAISCPVLDAPSSGHMSCSHFHGNFTYNSTCAFSCEAGFLRMGAEALRCAATGNWSRRPPVC
ncbi:LYAM3 protein, partial [Nothocercus nigrocapillus]|nr:LYAM3 protein [Nothocercus nigrocapillus]